jgi:hypothetical protein
MTCQHSDGHRGRTLLRLLSARLVGGLQAVLRIPIVALLLAMMVLVEIVGFSFQSLMPVVRAGAERRWPASANSSARPQWDRCSARSCSWCGDRGRRGSLLWACCGVRVMLAALGVSTLRGNRCSRRAAWALRRRGGCAGWICCRSTCGPPPRARAGRVGRGDRSAGSAADPRRGRGPEHQVALVRPARVL